MVVVATSAEQCIKALRGAGDPKHVLPPEFGINILGSAMANPVIVLDYDPNWPGLFQSLRKRIADALGDMAAIEHVGSTAVPDLAAKPIIDIDVLLASETMFSSPIERLAGSGYIHRVNPCVP